MMSLTTMVNSLNKNFLKDYNTLLIGGFEEPLYKASKNGEPAEIQFSHDYIRSALHELSHWCVAGVERRKLDDFGYWYAEDGRTQEQQNEFFKLEVKPQAIEWAFSIICGVTFEASVDNLSNQVDGVDVFKMALLDQLNYFIDVGFSQRVESIFNILAEKFDITDSNLYISQKLNEFKKLSC